MLPSVLIVMAEVTLLAPSQIAGSSGQKSQFGGLSNSLSVEQQWARRPHGMTGPRAHTVPTICPQLQINCVNYHSVFSLLEPFPTP